jgi:hypothetical protein
MINSTSSSDRVLRPEGPAHHTPTTAKGGIGADRFSPENSKALEAALEKHPAVRPEVVARGRELAADPSYPSASILRKVSEVILRSPDPLDQAD